VVVVVGPPLAQMPAEASLLDRALQEALAGMSLRDAVDRVAATTGEPRRAVYARALALAGKPSRGDSGPDEA